MIDSMKPYSYRKASIGSKLAALAAGKMPKSTPTKPEKPKARAIDQKGMLAGGKPGMLLDIMVPKP